MAADDKERQRARYLRGTAREEQHRTNRAQRRRREDPDRTPKSRPAGRRVEDWLDGAEDEFEEFEPIARPTTAQHDTVRREVTGPRFAEAAETLYTTLTQN